MNFAAMTNQTVAHGISQVERFRIAFGVAQSFDVVGKKKAVALMPKFLGRIFPLLLLQERIQTFFAKMSERRVPDVVPNRNRAGKFLVQSEIF